MPPGNSEMEYINTQVKALIGLGGAIVGLITSTQEHLLWGVQVFAALMGGLVAFASLIAIVSRWVKVQRKRLDDLERREKQLPSPSEPEQL